jgi:hypothetical protein
MAVLDTAIQEKPKYFNDPWMAGSVPGHDESQRFRSFHTLLRRNDSDRPAALPPQGQYWRPEVLI